MLKSYETQEPTFALQVPYSSKPLANALTILPIQISLQEPSTVPSSTLLEKFLRSPSVYRAGSPRRTFISTLPYLAPLYLGTLHEHLASYQAATQSHMKVAWSARYVSHPHPDKCHWLKSSWQSSQKFLTVRYTPCQERNFIYLSQKRLNRFV